MKNTLSLRSFARLMLSALLGTLLAVAAAVGQETTGTIEGTISDASGARIPGATVKVEGAAFVRTATTDSEGFYRMHQVPPGVYKINVAAPSFTSASVERVTVVLGKTTPVDLSLKVGNVTEQVVITSDNVARIDPTDNKIQTNITAQVIDALPKGNNLTSLLKIAPAARPEAMSGASTAGTSGGIQVDGASGSENSFIIDGQEVSNFRTGMLNVNNNLPFTFVQEIQIKTSGFEAEYGGATGGVINVVTKGGANQFHGEAGYQFEPNQLWASPRPILNSFRNGAGATFYQKNDYIQNKKDDFTNHFPSFALSGPIKQDRLWFFTSYAPQIFNTTRVTNYFTQNGATNGAIVANPSLQSQTYHQNFRQEYWQNRLDAAPFNTLRLSATYLWNPIIQNGLLPQNSIVINGVPASVNFGGSIGTLVGSNLAERQGGRQNSNNVTTQAVWTPTSKLVATFRFSRGFLNEKLNSYFIPQQTRFVCGGTSVPANATCGQGFQNITTNDNIFFDASVRRNFEGDVSYLANNFVGRHEFKGGYQNTRVSNSVSTGYIPYGIVQLAYGQTINSLTGRSDTVSPNAIGAGYIQRFGRTGNASNQAHSIYVQDRWQPLTRLSLNLGVRFEKENLPSFNGFAPPINFGWGDKIVPRLGVAFDLTGDGKSKIFASYGQFTDRLKFELPRGSFGGEFYRRDFFEITADHPEYTYYTLQRILGSNADVLNGQCPIPGSTGLTVCQYDYRVASNNPDATIGDGKVDPGLHAFRQAEFTIGYERELSNNFLLSARYSYKNLLWAIEDAGFLNAQGSEAYIIGNPGSGLHAQTARDFGYTKTAKPQRRYDALEIKLDRRFSKNYFFNAAYTYSRLYGNYGGLASSDESGRTSPGVNRYFDLPHIGFTAAGNPDNGRLPTDRPHVFNASGAYSFNWFNKFKGNETRFGLFTTIQSGTPLTSYYSFLAESILFGRGDLGRAPVFTQSDFDIRHIYRVTESKTLEFDFNVFNLFNEANTLTVIRTPASVNPDRTTLNLPASVTSNGAALGYILTNGIVSNFNNYLNNPANPERKNTALGFANGFQTGRQVRLGVRFTF